MSLEHEYALIGGINRAKIGRYLALVAATVSGWIVFLLLSVVNLAQRLGISANLPSSVLSLAGAGTIFGVLYWLFERYIWGWRPVGQLLKIPDLRGTWRCTGQSIEPDGSPGQHWKGIITVSQSWDKIRVRLKTARFGSNSISAALLHDNIDGYSLLYHYQNESRDRKSTRLNSSHQCLSRMPSSA